VSKEEFEALNRNYGIDVPGEVAPQSSTHPKSTTDGSTVCTANKHIFNGGPDGHCSACVAVLSKLDDILSSLSALSVKVDTLQGKLSTLCEKNAGHHG